MPVAPALIVLAAVLAVSIVLQDGRSLVGLFIAIGLLSGSFAAARSAATLTAAIPQGPGDLVGVAGSDPWPYGNGMRFVIRPAGWIPVEGRYVQWQGPAVVVIAPSAGVTAGDRVRVSGLLRSYPDRFRGDPVAGRLTASAVDVLESSRSPLFAAGNRVRTLVGRRLGALEGTPEAALLSGFLIGDIALLPRADYEALRRSGLTHYVAVSGSNVALVLAAWWLVIGPLRAGARGRAVTGLVVLAVFVVATRWESSVIRAATMAGIVLGGRAAGIPVDAWTALGSAVALLLVVSGDLALDVGFQLSVAATAGVLAGMRWWSDRIPRPLWSVLAATVAAQLAVFPLLLVHFGTVPLLAPLANLLAAPLVTAATALAGVGVITGLTPVLNVAEWVAGVILRLARVAGRWPQLDLLGVVALGGASLLALQPRVRPVIVGLVVGVTAFMMIPPGPPNEPATTFLDVGQGDAVLLRDPSGGVALIDGGPEPANLQAGLRRYGVRKVDLLVATHGDADHVAGFRGLANVIDVARLWVPAGQPRSQLLDEIIDELRASGVTVEEVGTGTRTGLGEFSIRVLGPRRRYAAENDGSVVLWVEARQSTVLLPGDIGATAQQELKDLRPDVLLVPHHGAATTDLEWLADTVGTLAIISVGPNNYGHPDSAVMATLQRHAGNVRTTRDEGDITVPLGRRNSSGAARYLVGSAGYAPFQ